MNNLKTNITIAALILSGICAENALSMRLDGGYVSDQKKGWAARVMPQVKEKIAQEKAEKTRSRRTPVIATIHEGPVRGSFTESGQIQRFSPTRPSSATIRRSAAAPKTQAKPVSHPARGSEETGYTGGIRYDSSAGSQAWLKKAQAEEKARAARERQRRLSRAASIPDSDGTIKKGFFQIDGTFKPLKK